MNDYKTDSLENPYILSDKVSLSKNKRRNQLANL